MCLVDAAIWIVLLQLLNVTTFISNAGMCRPRHLLLLDRVEAGRVKIAALILVGGPCCVLFSAAMVNQARSSPFQVARPRGLLQQWTLLMWVVAALRAARCATISKNTPLGPGCWSVKMNRLKCVEVGRASSNFSSIHDAGNWSTVASFFFILQVRP